MTNTITNVTEPVTLYSTVCHHPAKPEIAPDDRPADDEQSRDDARARVSDHFADSL